MYLSTFTQLLYLSAIHSTVVLLLYFILTLHFTVKYSILYSLNTLSDNLLIMIRFYPEVFLRSSVLS